MGAWGFLSIKYLACQSSYGNICIKGIISMILNKSLYILTSTLFLCLVFTFSCDSNNANNDLICSVQEMQDRFAETNCIAEELVMGCSNINCRNVSRPGIGEKEIRFSGFSNRCTILDCETMECELLVSGTDFELGLVSELVISKINGLPAGAFIINEAETPFDCIGIAVN